MVVVEEPKFPATPPQLLLQQRFFMDNKQMELYLEKIGELVIDENKIVTYKSLSKILDIHVNTAKQLLYTYLSKQKNETSVPISATYLLAGKLADGSFNISVLNETDLESSYSKFVEITSEHVYSIQKGKHVKEIQVLYGIDEQVQNVNSCGVIKCSKSILKTESNDDKKADYFTGGSKTKSPIKTKAAVEKDKEASGKIESCSKTNLKDNVSKANKEKETGNSKKQSGNIAAFFFNGAQKNLNKPKNILKTKNNSPDKDENKSSAVTIKAEAVEKDEKNKVESQSKENVKKKSGTSKRKRIQMISDSEESNSESDNEEIREEEEEDTPEPLPLSVILEEEEIIKDPPRNKKKKRKIVNKVVIGEDGFIETKLEEVIETDSEDEVAEKVAPPKKEDPAPKKLKLESFGEKGKKTSTSKPPKIQSSLLAFLKKK